MSDDYAEQFNYKTRNMAPATPRMLRTASQSRPDEALAPRTHSRQLSSQGHQRTTLNTWHPVPPVDKTNMRPGGTGPTRGFEAAPVSVAPVADQVPASGEAAGPAATEAVAPPQQFHRKAIGDWDFLKTIGAGSMGKVKLAKHSRTGDVCAVKIVPRASKIYARAHAHDPLPVDKAEAAKRAKEYAKEVARDKRTIREGALGRLLYHPYICRLYEMIPMSNHYYMLFEYVQGGQMLDYIVSHGSLKERHARKFARGIASALDYCHRNSVVHRDLKIENIMISKTGEVKLIDFGLSNMFDKQHLLSTYCGSLYFAAPELLSAQPYVGPEVDVWSFGVVLYVLVCGKVPFDDPSVSALHEKIKRGKVDYPDHLSRECLSLLSRMLVVRPEKRATLQEVMNHPWMVKGYDGPLSSYMPLRFPLALPLDPQIVLDMVNLDMGLEELIQTDLSEILDSAEYRAASAQWYVCHNAGVAYAGTSDPTNAYHPLISIYYLVEEMRKRKRVKTPAPPAGPMESRPPMAAFGVQSQLPLKPLVPLEPLAPLAQPQAPPQASPQAPPQTPQMPQMPPPVSEWASPSAPPATYIPTIAYGALLPRPSTGASPTATTNPPGSPGSHLPSQQIVRLRKSPEESPKGFGLFRRFSAKKPKDALAEAPPLPKLDFSDASEPKVATTGPHALEGAWALAPPPLEPNGVRRNVSMKVTTREQAKSPSGSGEQVRGHTRTASAALAVPSSSAVPVSPPQEYDDFEVSGNFAPPKPSSRRKLHPTARAKSVGHMRMDNRFDMPPLPTHLKAHVDGNFDEVALDASGASPSIATLTHQSHLTDRQVEAQAARAPAGSMPSIEFPRTLFLKGFFTVQTTSTKSPAVIRYSIVNVLSDLGVSFTEVKGGFLCVHTPLIEPASPLVVYEPATTAEKTPEEVPEFKSHRRKFSLGTTLLSYRRKADSGMDLYDVPQFPAMSNLQDSAFNAESDESLDSMNGAGHSDILVSSRVEQRKNHPETVRKARLPLKFEIHLVKVPLVGLYGVQFKKVMGNTWMYKALAGQILGELNL